MANSSVETCPAGMRYDGFHPLRTDGIELQYGGLADTVVVKAGDVLVFNSAGAIALGTDGGVTAANFAGIAAADAGSATASANDDTKVPFFMPSHSQRFWAKVEDGTIAETDVGEIVDLSSEDGLDVTDQDPETTDMEGSTVMLVGFKILAADTTNNYAKGVFVGF